MLRVFVHDLCYVLKLEEENGVGLGVGGGEASGWFTLVSDTNESLEIKCSTFEDMG